MDKNAISKLLIEYEEENQEVLGKVLVKGFNAWHIVKTQLYWGIIEKQIRGNEDVVIKKEGPIKRIAGKAREFPFLFYSVLKLVAKRLARKRPVLFYTYSGDKLAKDSDGKYVNFLSDIIVTAGITKSYIYAERSIQGDFKTPSKVDIDFKVDSLDCLRFFFLNYYKKNSKIRKAAGTLFLNFSGFLSRKNVTLPFSENVILLILVSFCTEFYLSLLLLRICRPSFIITSEKIGTGLLGAANKLGIGSLDLQHGIIDRFHPQYIFRDNRDSTKAKLLLSSFVGVFGELHKKILLNNGFWKEKEIVVLGSSRVDMNRKKYRRRDDKWSAPQKRILVPSQWTAFDETIILLNALCANISTYSVVLKIHPLEPPVNIARFNQLSKEYSGRLIIADKDLDIYTLIEDAFLLIGFDSAALLEAVTLGVPCITITTKKASLGIHSMFNDERLKTAIIPIDLSQPASIIETINRSIEDFNYYTELVASANKQGDYLYADHYIENCQEFVNTVVK